MEYDCDFQGEIRVASRIIDYLSSGLYQSPAACLKELINNAYDADATEVQVWVKSDGDSIIIEDNGCGLNRQDFERHFMMISESFKREETSTSPQGRPLIGKIGIGFIAANEICNEMQVISTQAGSTDLLDVTISFDLMRADPSARRRGETSFAKAVYCGKTGSAEPASHFTRVFLRMIRGAAKDILAGAGVSLYSSGEYSLYGLSERSVQQVLMDGNLQSWSIFDAYSKNRLEVALNVPIRYHKQWLPRHFLPQVTEIEKAVDKLNFRVFFDGSELRKPVVFNPAGEALISPFTYQGMQVSASGYFYAQRGAIHPQELQGLLVRIRHAAIGGYDPNFLEFSAQRGGQFKKWISGEILVDDRLEDALNIDRKTLRNTHPAYVELQLAVHAHVDRLIAQVRSDIFSAGAQERKRQRAAKSEQKIHAVTAGSLDKLALETAHELSSAWQSFLEKEGSEKQLLRKYSIDQIYKLVIEAAGDSLSPEDMQVLLKGLTGRLQA
ncbi:MAG TPA: ATP-binding protein [Levilinea sp.]|nr:ATP-binding protein [Levilinea sp.]